ncbi:hypothetical protein [Massilia sp. LjRoot122]|uniref:hypothetical protein n=1 Tax=Massilia sp. LjRoot122 TaxID=3342257 RepID=UPI003ECC26C3
MKHAAPVLMIQDVWSRWTKRSRAAADAATRLALPRAHTLPLLTGDATIRHEVAALEEYGFEPRQLVRTLDDPAWAHDRPMRPDNLRVRRVGDGFAVTLLRPWEGMLTTKWPAWLPSPLFEGGLGDAVRIDWNARFRSSMGGSNRSYFYEEHTIWVTLQAAPTDATFLALAPIKHIDLRTTIY